MRIVAAALLLALWGCASPDPAMYTLRAVPGQPVGGAPATVKIARPGLAGYLDRPEIVRDSTSNRLDIKSGERWGEPLGDMIGRVLSLDLSQRLPGTTVFTEAGSISTDALGTVELDVQRFDLDPDGEVILLAQVAVQQGRDHDLVGTRTIRIATRPSASDTPALVSAESQALGQLSDQIAAMLRTAPLPLPGSRAALRR